MKAEGKTTLISLDPSKSLKRTVRGSNLKETTCHYNYYPPKSGSPFVVKYRHSYDSRSNIDPADLRDPSGYGPGNSLSSLPIVSRRKGSKLSSTVASSCDSCLDIHKSSPLTIMSYKADSDSPKATTFWSPRGSLLGEKMQHNSSAKRCSNSKPNIRWKTRSSMNSSASKYPDPLQGANKAFLRRISELASLELESIKYEKSKKKKKKKPQESSQ